MTGQRTRRAAFTGRVTATEAIAFEEAPVGRCPETDEEKMKALYAALDTFATEAKQRKSQQQFSLLLAVGQKYILRELRAYYSTLQDEEEDRRANIARLEGTFKRPVSAAVCRQLNAFRRNGMTGEILVRNLTDLRIEHGLDQHGTLDRDHITKSEEQPHIICTEALV